MHELSLCSALLCQLERIALEHHSSRVSRVYVSVGPLSGVEPTLLSRAYPVATAGSIAEDSELVIESEDIVVRCIECGAISAVPVNRLVCGRCGAFRTTVTSGDGLILRRVELQPLSLQAERAS